MVNLLRISFILLFLCSCVTKESHISPNINVNDVNYQYEELYLNEITFNLDENKDIHIDNENWNIIKTNLIKIHYHILKLQSQIK